jgi:hypothetical protein
VGGNRNDAHSNLYVGSLVSIIGYPGSRLGFACQPFLELVKSLAAVADLVLLALLHLGIGLTLVLKA